MVATQTTLQNILKEFYIGPVQDQLNNEMMVLELMEKTTVDWNGRVAIIPVHTARNTGVSYLDEVGTVGGQTALPAASTARSGLLDRRLPLLPRAASAPSWAGWTQR